MHHVKRVGPFQQVKRHNNLRSRKHKYMIESCNSSTFNISQEIFQHVDSSDDAYFNSDVSTYYFVPL